VVTGGASGIGLAAVEALRAGGAEVHVLDRAGTQPVDVTDLAQLEAAFAEFPRVDIVVANAGLGREAGLTETTPEHWQRTIDVNLTGVFHTVRLAAGRMKPRRTGSIVITASTNSYDGEARLTAYNASKAGVLGILHTAANELGLHGIRVNAVCPGLIRTPLTQRHFDSPGLLRDYFRHIPLGRGGEAPEVAAAIAFLASDLASYITGAALLVDGGQMAAKFGLWDDKDALFEDGAWKLR